MSQYDDNFRPIDLKDVKTYPLSSRSSKVNLNDFAKPLEEGLSSDEFLRRLPNILAVQTLRQLVSRIRRARELQKPIIWGIGGHVIKTGLAPLLIDLMKRGLLTAVAANGSVLVHDAEIAMVGSTSEDVDATLSEGAFGGAEETVVFSIAQQKKVQSPGLAWVKQWAARCSLSSQSIATILFCAQLTKPGFLSQPISR